MICSSYIGRKLSEKIDPAINTNDNYQSYLNEPTNAQFKFNYVSEKEILKIIDSLKNNSSYGTDEISNKLLKSIKNEICKPLTLIINQSLTTGIFPNAFKTSKVKLIYKKGDIADLNNYRPISLLPTISKVFERVIHTQIVSYLCTNNLLCEQQYGFRAKHSTELASIKLVDFLTQNMDSNKIPTAVYLNFSKAFDTLSFEILLNKLKYYGFTDVSEKIQVTMGIPQGSILGPLFFSIYINDIMKASNKFKYIMYADDTTLYFNLEDFNEQDKESAINNELQKIHDWLQRNKLTLNVAKTKFMTFHKRREVPDLKLSLNNKDIDKVNTFSFLGILVDSDLCWKSHINMIRLKISRLIGILHRVKRFLPKTILITIYKSLIMPHLNYGLLLWGPHLSRLVTLQKKAIRVVSLSDYLSHTDPIFKELKLLTLEDMFTLQKFKFLHKLAHNTLPTYFDTYKPFLTRLPVVYNLRPHALALPRIYHVYAESCLVYQLVKLYNDTTYDPLIFRKIEEKSHSAFGFKQYVTASLLDKYSQNKICNIPDCYSCKR